MKRKGILAAACVLSIIAVMGAGRRVAAHCDTLAGPVVQDAKLALARGDVTPVLKWVGKDDEAQIRSAFANTIKVRAQGTDAAKLADQYFFETLVRVHRAGEGAPYSGIKDEPVDPVIAMAEGALSSGSTDDMVARLQAHMAAAVREKYAAVATAAKDKDKSVEAGRRYVAAYITYMHYIEGLHASMVAAGDVHGSAPPTHTD